MVEQPNEERLKDQTNEPLGVCDRNKDTLKQPHVRKSHCKNWRPVEASELLVVCDKLAEPHDCFKVHDCLNPRPVEVSAPAAPPVDSMAGLVTSNHEVEMLDEGTSEVVKVSYEGIDGCVRQTANVGAWYYMAVFWKSRALAAPDAELRELRAKFTTLIDSLIEEFENLTILGSKEKQSGYEAAMRTAVSHLRAAREKELEGRK